MQDRRDGFFDVLSVPGRLPVHSSLSSSSSLCGRLKLRKDYRRVCPSINRLGTRQCLDEREAWGSFFVPQAKEFVAGRFCFTRVVRVQYGDDLRWGAESLQSNRK